MAELTTGSTSGGQGTTQNPQTVPAQTVGASKQSGGVQPGTAASVLTSQQGLSLHSSALTTVNLDATPSTQTGTVTSLPKQSIHHGNLAFLGISVVFILVAIGLFLAMGRSAKSTTN